MYPIGAHLKKECGSLLKTIKVIQEFGGNTLQLFASNPRSIQPVNLQNYKDIADNICNYCKKHDFRLIIHAPYTINLAKELKNDKRIIDFKDAYWINSILSNLRASDIIGSIGVVVHVGKYTTNTKENGVIIMHNAIKYIINIMQKEHIISKLIIETPAGAGTELLTTVEEFSEFYNSFNDIEKKHIGICLDTAHVWSSGYDINEYYKMLSKTNGKEIIAIHYNNSKKNKGSKVDVHENIFDGKITIEVMKEFISNLKHKPMIILEKPSDDLKIDFDLIKSSLKN